MFNRYASIQLQSWSNKTNRKPLIVRGARQVGKTTIINTFGNTFRQYIYLNLENELDKRVFNMSSDIDSLVQSIFLAKNKKFEDCENTLLFIDEIQEVPGALNMLRYFYEQYPQLRVIAAGSLLETIFNRGLSFPVGRVEFLIIRPASFGEFLGAIGEKMVLEQLEKIPVNDFAHNRLLQLFHTYAIIGGMPEIVEKYAATKDLTAIRSIYGQLITTYIDDVEKYGRNNTAVRVIRHCIRNIFIEGGKRITFHHFGRSDYASREVGEALRTLERTFLMTLLYPTISATLPLTPDYRKSPRLQVIDTGIMNHFLGIQTDIIGTCDLNKIYQGLMIEHLVGQELLSCQSDPLSALNFWTREKKTSMAEVDFVYVHEGMLIPIEVKSGKDGSLKSLHIFMDEAPHDIALRFYGGPLQLTEITTPAGKNFILLSLPYYLTSQVVKYIDWLQREGKAFLSALKKSIPPHPKAPP